MVITVKGGEYTRSLLAKRGVTAGKIRSRSSSRKSSGVFVEDSARQQSRELSPFEAAGLEDSSGGMTSLTGETVYVSYKPEDIKSSFASPRTKESITKQATSVERPSVIEPRVVSKAQLVREKLSAQVGQPFKEGFTLAPVGESYRGDYGKTVSQRLSYGAGLVSSVAVSAGKAGAAAGRTGASLIGRSGTATRATETLSRLFSTKTGQVATKVGTGLYATFTTIKVAETPKEERVRKLFGVGREVASFAGVSEGLKGGFRTVAKESEYLFKGKTTATTALVDSKSATAAKSEGILYRTYKNRLIKEGKILQVSKQKAITNELLTETGAPSGTSRIEGVGYSSTELRRGKRIAQASTFSTFRGATAESREAIEITMDGASFEKGVFQSRSEVASSVDRFIAGKRTVASEGSITKSKGVFTSEKGVTLKEGLTSSFSDKIVSQSKTKEFVFDISGKELPKATGSSLQTQTILQSQQRGLQEIIGKTQVSNINVKVVPISSFRPETSPSVEVSTIQKSSSSAKVVPFTESKLVVGQKSSVSLQSVTTVSQATRATQASLSGRTSSVARSGVSSISGTSSIVSQVQTPVSATASKLLQRTKQTTETFRSPITPPTSFLSSLRAPKIRPFSLAPIPLTFRFKSGGGKESALKRSSFASKRIYSPSVTGIALGITSSTAPSTKSGLNVRPIISGGKKMKKRRMKEAKQSSSGKKEGRFRSALGVDLRA